MQPNNSTSRFNPAASIRENQELSRIEAPVYHRNHFEIFHPWEQNRLREKAGVWAKAGRILDVGTGTGNVISKVPEGPLRVGVDLSPEMIEQARRKFPDLFLVVAESGALPFADGTFDIVVTYSALHHVPDSLAAVLEMFRVLAPGGTLFLDHEEIFQQGGWRRPAYQVMRAALQAMAAAWYWRRPQALAWLPYRRVHWPLSATFCSVNFAVTEGTPVLPALLEAELANFGCHVRRTHYLLAPLPMESRWQGLADLPLPLAQDGALHP